MFRGSGLTLSDASPGWPGHAGAQRLSELAGACGGIAPQQGTVAGNQKMPCLRSVFMIHAHTQTHTVKVERSATNTTRSVLYSVVAWFLGP